MTKTALLILDVQAGNLAQLQSPSDYLALLAKTITEARPYVKIIYVKIGFRPGHPEIAASNTLFSAAAKANRFVSGSPEAAMYETHSLTSSLLFSSLHMLFGLISRTSTNFLHLIVTHLLPHSKVTSSSRRNV